MNTNICLGCLQKRKPWVNKDKVILHSQLSHCNECNKNKQLVFCFVGERPDKLFNVVAEDIKVLDYPWNDACKKLDFSLQTLVCDLGWGVVRNKYMYIKGQEEGKPLAFKTHEEYKPYLNYRVVELGNKIIIEPRVTVE